MFELKFVFILSKKLKFTLMCLDIDLHRMDSIYFLTHTILYKIVFLHRADVLRENTEAVFAACDAAHGRWAKLLGVRAGLHPKLRLQEFLSMHDITQEFITATERVYFCYFACVFISSDISLELSFYIFVVLFHIMTTSQIGGRLGYSIRGTLQSQAKAFVDSQHDSRVSVWS